MAVTEASIDAALREMLPQMKATTVTMNIVTDMLAELFEVGVKELKAEWKHTIKDKVLELMHLCPDYDDPAEEEDEEEEEEEDKEEEDKEEEEEEEVPKPRRVPAATKKRRNAISDDSDAQDDGDSEPQGFESGGDAESEDEDEAPKKRRRVSKTKERAAPKKQTQPAKKVTKQADPPGLSALKELGRAAGVLNPKVYKELKQAQSTDEAEEVVRDRLQEAGVRFSGHYPSPRDISAAKKKRARDKELEDIDTSLIIDSGRPRRSSAQVVTYAAAPIPDADGAVVNVAGTTADEEEEAEFEEEEADDEDADEDASGSGSDESEAEF